MQNMQMIYDMVSMDNSTLFTLNDFIEIESKSVVRIPN